MLCYIQIYSCRMPFKYMRYHVLICFVIPKPSFVQLPSAPLELAAGELWCSAGQAGGSACASVLAREQGSHGHLLAGHGQGQARM